MAIELNDIRTLFEIYGPRSYGSEAVTQMEHALQSAYLGEQEGASKELVVAAFLHDLGHMLGTNKGGDAQTTRKNDDLHQFVALPFLRPVFPSAVVEPIGMHVEAKRCLCAIDPTYHAGLSPQSVRSLEQQGGIHTPEQAAEFHQKPFAADALRLRRWDDLAKVPGASMPPFEHYFAMVTELYGRQSSVA